MSLGQSSGVKSAKGVARTSDSQEKTRAKDEERLQAPSQLLLHLPPLLHTLSWFTVLFVHCLASHYHLTTSRLYAILQSSSLASRLVAFDIVDASIGDQLETLRGIHIAVLSLHVAGAVMMLKTSLEDLTWAFYGVDFTQWVLVHFERIESNTLWLWIAELFLHTIFAYRVSERVAIDRRWSSLHVSLLVLSCMSASIAVVFKLRRHRFSTSSQQLTRLLFLVLHCVAVIVIPLIRLLQYTDWDHLDDHMEWLKDMWVVTFCDDMRTILYESWADTVVRVLLSLKLVADLLFFKALLRRQTVSGIAIQPLFFSLQRAIANRRSMHKSATNVQKVQRKTSNAPLQDGKLNWMIARTAMAVVLAAWGVSIAAISTKSEHFATETSPICASSKFPWLKSQAACRVIDINCAKLQIGGRSTELHSLWSVGFDPTSLQILVVRHCSQLELPTSLRDITDLKILRIYNSTIVSWPVEASIETTSMRRLHTLSLVRVMFPSGDLPPGILSPQIPSSLRFVSIIQTNLARLPVDLDSLWKPLGPQAALAIESSGLTEIPAVLYRLNVGSLMLANNAIREIPPELFQLDHLRVFSLGFTNVIAFPANVTKLGDALSVVSILGTGIADIPHWFDAFLSEDRVPPPSLNNAFRLKAGSTKWCNSLVANLRDRRVASHAAKTDCGSMDMIGFPLGFVTMRYGASVDLHVEPPPPFSPP